MTEPLRIRKAIEYGLVAAVAASLVVMLLAAIIFGVQFNLWPEWQGRVIGVVATIVSIAAAAVGVSAALRVCR